MKSRALVTYPLALLLLGALAHAQESDTGAPAAPVRPVPRTTMPATIVPPVTIFSDILGQPTAAVPGLPGASFGSFDRPYGSPNGNWVLTADTDLPTTEDEVLLLNSVVVGREGTPAPWEAGQLHGTIDTQIGVNDAGEFVFSTNVSPSTVDDDYVIKVSPGPVYTVVARESDPIVPLPGVFYDDTLDSALIVDDGRVFFSADLIDGAITTTTDEILVFGDTVLAQEGVSSPTGQAGGLTEFWDNFDFEDGWMSADGSHWLQQGDLTSATTEDDVVVVDGAVVLQENQVIPGSGFAEPIDDSGIVGVSMDWAGNWYARGNNDVTEQDWVVRNGTVIAAVGQPVTPVSTELYSDAPYSDCFFAHTGNSNGDWVIGGVTDNADLLLNGVLVLNGTRVVVRESDPIDLDNNGIYDDDAYFNTFGNDDLVLTNDLKLLFVATIKDGTGTSIGEGFFELDLDNDPTTYCTSKVSSSGCVPTIGYTGLPSPTGSFEITCSNVEANRLGIGIWSVAGDNGGGQPWQGGFLCESMPIIRLLPVLGSGGAAPCSGSFTREMTSVITTLPPGTQVWSQFWFRDPPDADGVGLSNALTFVTLP